MLRCVLCVRTVCCLQSTGSIVPHTDSSRSSSLTIITVIIVRKVKRIVMMTNVITIIKTAIATRGRIIKILMMMETTGLSISIIVITKYQSFVRISFITHILSSHVAREVRAVRTCCWKALSKLRATHSTAPPSLPSLAPRTSPPCSASPWD